VVYIFKCFIVYTFLFLTFLDLEIFDDFIFSFLPRGRCQVPSYLLSHLKGSLGDFVEFEHNEEENYLTKSPPFN